MSIVEMEFTVLLSHDATGLNYSTHKSLDELG